MILGFFFLHHFLQKLYLKNVMSFVSRLSFQNNSCNNFMYTEWYNLEKRKVSGLKHITVCNILGLRSGKHTHTDGIRVGFIYWGKTQYSPPPLYPSVWSTLDAVISPIWSQAAQGHCWVPPPPPPPCTLTAALWRKQQQYKAEAECVTAISGVQCLPEETAGDRTTEGERHKIKSGTKNKKKDFCLWADSQETRLL